MTHPYLYRPSQMKICRGGCSEALKPPKPSLWKKFRAQSRKNHHQCCRTQQRSLVPHAAAPTIHAIVQGGSHHTTPLRHFSVWAYMANLCCMGYIVAVHHPVASNAEPPWVGLSWIGKREPTTSPPLTTLVSSTAARITLSCSSKASLSSHICQNKRERRENIQMAKPGPPTLASQRQCPPKFKFKLVKLGCCVQ